ncbi:MAG: hypothetical protein GWN67_07895, partial [Phycisphaerae bacterium]|nr:hypothetical protein [Phycisphaerae bacterium]NIP51930.1 hypothetical protein [Phycisphaerae bacterium]NIS51051.1 hypothetical protein [Phycisphaerae bacterium]NIU08666.1 hypothetical protein [Phycisphaerae bacterium]NIU56297.1 hypothetical protein [Phycisphaerae bacterium]
MKKLLLIFLVAFAFCTTAMASDIAFYVGQWNTDGWYDASQFTDVATIIAQAGHLFGDIQQFDDTQVAAFGTWIDDNTNDGELDIIWLNGCMPSVLYPYVNLEPDGSRAELWLDGGNMIINVGDWFAYVSYECGGRCAANTGTGAANILDLAAGIIQGSSGGVQTPTAAGTTYLPSLNAVDSVRPIVLSQVTGDWEVAEIFAQNAGGTHADPVVIHNTVTDGYLAIVNQSTNWIADRGLTCAEFLVNWADEKIGFDTTKARNPDPKNGAIDVPVDANLAWVRGDGAVQDDVYFGTDPCALPKVTTILSVFPPTYDPPGDLVASTTYYWRIDEVNGPDIVTGDVWSFTTIRGEAQCDYPYDGAIISGDMIEFPSGSNNWFIWTKLTFIRGATAADHTGYFNVDYSKVQSRAQDANLGSPPYASIPGWEYTYFAGNPQVPPANQTLVRGTKYFWTVDAKDAQGNVFGGDIWEFAIQGFKAFAPSPPNEAIFISTTPFLSWLPGFGVESHEIYMGTSWEDVNNAEYNVTTPPPEFVIARSEPNYQVVTALPHSTKIYWRVDEVQGRVPPFFIPTAFYKGDVWEFTTLPEGVGQIREDLWWNITGTAIGNLYAHPNFPGQPDETRMLNSFDSGTGLAENYGGMIHGWLHPAYSGDYTFWLCTDDDGELFLSTDDTPANMVRIANIAGWSGPYQWIGGAGAGTRNQESAPISLVAGQKYYIRATWKEGGGGDHCQVAWQGPDQPLAPVNGSAAAVIPGSRLSPFVQLWAHDPDPRNMQYAVPTMYSLRWGPGDHAAQHDVYYGTDKAAVTNATPSTPGIYKGRIGPNSLGPLAFDAAQFYYWRVDEV